MSDSQNWNKKIGPYFILIWIRQPGVAGIRTSIRLKLVQFSSYCVSGLATTGFASLWHRWAALQKLAKLNERNIVLKTRQSMVHVRC